MPNTLQHDYDLTALLKRFSDTCLSLVGKYVGFSNTTPIFMLRALGRHSVMSRFPTRSDNNTPVIKFYCSILGIHFRRIFGREMPDGLSPSQIINMYRFEVEKCLDATAEQHVRQRAAVMLLGSPRHLAKIIISSTPIDEVDAWATLDSGDFRHPLVKRMGRLNQLFELLRFAHPCLSLIDAIDDLFGFDSNVPLSTADMRARAAVIDVAYAIYNPNMTYDSCGIALRKRQRRRDTLLLLAAQCGASHLGANILKQEFGDEANFTLRKRRLLTAALQTAFSAGTSGLLHRIIEKIPAPWRNDIIQRLLPRSFSLFTVPDIAILTVLRTLKEGDLKAIKLSLNNFGIKVRTDDRVDCVQEIAAANIPLPYKQIFISTAIQSGQMYAALYFVNDNLRQLFDVLRTLSPEQLGQLVPHLIVSKYFIDKLNEGLASSDDAILRSVEKGAASQPTFLELFQTAWERMCKNVSSLREEMVKAIATANKVDGVPKGTVGFLTRMGCSEGDIADWMASAGCITGFNQVLPELNSEETINAIMAAVASNQWYFLVSVSARLEDERLPEIITRICCDANVEVRPEVARLLTALIDRLSGTVDFLLPDLKEAINLNRPVSILNAIFSGIVNRCPEALSVDYIKTVLGQVRLMQIRQSAMALLSLKQNACIPHHEAIELCKFEQIVHNHQASNRRPRTTATAVPACEAYGAEECKTAASTSP